MKELEMTAKEKAELLGTKLVQPLYYKFSDYKYNTNSKERVLSGIRELDRMISGFELGCITIWTGGTNCLDCDTEYFNGKGWKKISEYTSNERVLQYNANGTASLEKPIQYIKQKCEKMCKFESKSIDMVTTFNHDLVYVGDKDNKIKKMKMYDVIENHNQNKGGFRGKIITSFKYSGNGINLSDEELRVMVMTICDGSFRKNKTNQCCLNLKKERKIERAERLLNLAGIAFTKIKNKEGYTRIYYKAPLKVKEFPLEWYQATNKQFRLIADECLLWDGTLTKSGNSFSSNNKNNADFIQFAVTALDRRANIEIFDRRGFKRGKYIRKSVDYEVIFSKRTHTLVSLRNPHKKQEFKTVQPSDGMCYCFTMPSGMLVVRRNGKIMVTGNSGKTTVMTMITKQSILQGEKVFYFNGEQTKDDFKNNLYKQTVEKGHIYEKQYKDSPVFDYFVDKSESEKLDRLYGDKLFLYNNEATRTIDFLIQAMDEVRVKYGVRVFMLDNFMQIDTETADEYREQKDIMEKIRTFAVNKNVHVHLVVHQKKTDKNNPRITIYDVFGSSNIVNKAYNVISIIRVDTLEQEGSEFKRLSKEMFKGRYDITQTGTVLEILKTKGLCCGMVGLIYDPRKKTFYEQPQLTSEMYERAKAERMKSEKGYNPF